jgi:hypothetical protein
MIKIYKRKYLSLKHPSVVIKNKRHLIVLANELGKSVEELREEGRVDILKREEKTSLRGEINCLLKIAS